MSLGMGTDLFTESNELRRSQIFIAGAAFTRPAPLGAGSEGTCLGLKTAF